MGPGGFGGPGGESRKILKQFDKDKDGLLNATERAQAREFLKSDGAGGNRRRGPGGPGGPGGGRAEEPAGPGIELKPSDVPQYPKASLYDPTVVRTIFIELESPDWEIELADFYNTDVDVPATLIVDGVRYPKVGISFRGASSYFMVPAGHKRSLNISMDLGNPKQRLYGIRTLNLLNAAGDPSFLSTVLFSQIAREHIPAPRANFVRVAINGENWGLYTNVEQFNADFTKRAYGSAKGARWKVSGSPNATSGLDYIGDDIADYRRKYDLKTKDNEADWKALINLCRVLSTTPDDELEAALRPILDINSALWFIALDNTLANSDGYWTRASDYSIYRDPKGVFHIIPHDMNEAFSGEGGPGFGPGGPGGGPGPSRRGPGGDVNQPGPRLPPGDRAEGPTGDRAGGPPADRAQPGRAGGGNRQRSGGATLDPLIGLADAKKPLRSRLLAVPALRAQYLDHVRTLAEKNLDWTNLGPIVASYRSLIREHIQADTRKLSSLEAFDLATADTPPEDGGQPRRARSLRSFVDERRTFLLGSPDIKTPPQDPAK